MREEREDEKKREKKLVQDLFCMGANKKKAMGPNPLSIRRTTKVISKQDRGNLSKVKLRRKKKGKRSKELSRIKNEQKANGSI